MVKEFVAIYNHERSHLALKYKTPDEVHQPFYGQKTVNLYQEQLKPGAYFHERRSLNNSPISFTVKWFTEFGHLNRGDMLTSEQHRCHNEKKKFQRRV